MRGEEEAARRSKRRGAELNPPLVLPHPLGVPGRAGSGTSALRRVTALCAVLVSGTVLLTTAAQNPAGPAAQPPSGSRSGAGPVRLTDNGASVTFKNQAGKWTIRKQCSDQAGPAYVSTYVTPQGYTAVHDGAGGGPGQYVDPRWGGLGMFGYDEGQGPAPYKPDGNSNWNVSPRRCGTFGVVSTGTPHYGVDGSGRGYYRQELQLADSSGAITTDLTYLWEFDAKAAQLYVLAAPVSGPGAADFFIKGPLFINSLNGRLGEYRASHVSTLTPGRKYLAGADVSCKKLHGTAANCLDAGYRCSWTPRPNTVPWHTTAKCYARRRAITRFDYGAALNGDCNHSDRICFDMTAEAYTVYHRHLRRGLPSYLWQSDRGMDRWALAAAREPAAGSQGCPSMGTVVTSPAQSLARNWEMDGYANAKGRFTAVDVKEKAWDNCVGLYDGGALFRNVRTAAYASHFIFALDPRSLPSKSVG